MLNSDLQSISKLRERDMDLLFLEEITENPKIRALIRKSVGINEEEEKFEGAWHSVRIANLGETDIALKFRSGGKSIIILIENKIDARFTLGQPERYQLRAKERLKDDLCDVCEVLFVAPENYLSGSPNSTTNFLMRRLARR